MIEKYEFGGRLSKEFPSQVIVDLTERCNLACTHCLHSELAKESGNDSADLPVELNEKMVAEVREAGHDHTQYIRYTAAGEPLMHPYVLQMIADAVSNGNVPVSMTTNGTLLDQAAIEGLLSTGLDLIDVSIDSFRDESYQKIRIGGNLSLTRKNVLNLIRAAEGRTRVAVSMIAQAANKGEEGDFEKFWYDHGVDSVFIRRLHSNAGMNQEVAESIRDLTKDKKRRPCVYPWERIVLSARGTLGFCPADWWLRARVADYRETTIEAAWNGDIYVRLRNAHLSGDYSQHSFCGNCPDWAMVRWPHEGRSYADLVRDSVVS